MAKFSNAPLALSRAACDVVNERRRQIEVEGWDPAHDDEYDSGQLAKAASCYALCAGIGIASGVGREDHYEFFSEYAKAGVPRPPWPWSDGWWKPKIPRRDLVRAAALIIAEIERLDRLAARKEAR